MQKAETHSVYVNKPHNGGKTEDKQFINEKKIQKNTQREKLKSYFYMSWLKLIANRVILAASPRYTHGNLLK